MGINRFVSFVDASISISNSIEDVDDLGDGMTDEA